MSQLRKDPGGPLSSLARLTMIECDLAELKYLTASVGYDAVSPRFRPICRIRRNRMPPAFPEMLENVIRR